MVTPVIARSLPLSATETMLVLLLLTLYGPAPPPTLKVWVVFGAIVKLLGDVVYRAVLEPTVTAISTCAPPLSATETVVVPPLTAPMVRVWLFTQPTAMAASVFLIK